MKNKKIIIIVSIIIFLLAAISIGFGLYFNYISKPSNIFGYGIDILSDNFKNYIYPEDELNVGDTFNVEGSIDFNLDSEYYLRKGKENVDDQKTYNFIKNISNMDTNYVIKQNKNEKTAYLSVNQKIKDEEILDTKLYVSNATKYYFVNSILKNYVNDGTCNYFEILSEENTNKDNIDYLYEFFIGSIKKNFKDEYFTSYDVEENIGGSKKNVHQISLEVNDKLIHKILNGILKDLKSDEKANFILSSIDNTFEKYKIKDDKKFLSKNEKYTINVYTTKFLYKPLKYEVIYLDNDIKKTYIYEGDSLSGSFYYLESDSVKYTADIDILPDNIKAKIYDSVGNDIGEVKVEKDGIDRTFDFVFDNGESKWDVVYYSKFTKAKKEIKNEKKVSFKYVYKKESKLNGDITLTNTISRDAKINEDISNAVLDSKLKEEEKKAFESKKDKVKERLEK